MNEDTLRQINQRIRRPVFAVFICSVVTLFALLIACTPAILQSLVDLPVSPLLLAMLLYALAGLIEALGAFKVWTMHHQETLKRTSIVHYHLDDCARDSYTDVQNACRSLAEASCVWQIVGKRSNREWKRNAGVSALVKRRRVKTGLMRPPFLMTDLEVYGIAAGKAKLFFMPGELLVFKRGRYQAFAYDALEVRALPARYVEDGRVPADAKVVGQTPQFVRRDGQPDLRFARNRRVPVVAYGLVELTSTSGLDLRLHVSNLPAARQFARLLPVLGRRQPSPPSLVHPAPADGARPTGARWDWLRRLEHGRLRARPDGALKARIRPAAGA
jgi:hypothetical protein